MTIEWIQSMPPDKQWIGILGLAALFWFIGFVTGRNWHRLK